MQENNKTSRRHALSSLLIEDLDMQQKIIRLEEKLIDLAVSNYIHIKETDAPRYIVVVGDYVVNERALMAFHASHSSAEKIADNDIDRLLSSLYDGFIRDNIAYITFYGATLYTGRGHNWRNIVTTIQTARLAHSKTDTDNLLFEFINSKAPFQSVSSHICRFNYERNALAYGRARDQIINTPDWQLIDAGLADITSAEMFYSNNTIRDSIRNMSHTLGV